MTPFKVALYEDNSRLSSNQEVEDEEEEQYIKNL